MGVALMTGGVAGLVSHEGTTRSLIGYLFYGPRIGACARLGPGARPVALSAAAHDPSCGSLMACAGRALLSRERLKRGLLGSK
jgi:hypothetical protein